PKMDGVSTNLALIFGTLLSSQGTDASFVLTLSDILWGFPPGASLRCFQLSRSDFRFRHPLDRAAELVFAFALSLSGFSNPTSLFPHS
ncbi:hypothetical protein, partial [Streptomyces sp. NPDC059909]|uniref:hypothetical protein n=1 Tax=Streptomyces sp. NPDC059909 TaxID=3346998 RepID=UPI00365107D6